MLHSVSTDMDDNLCEGKTPQYVITHPGQLSLLPLFVLCGRGPAYSGPQRWELHIGPMCQPRERRGIGMCGVCAHCVGWMKEQ